MIPMLGIVANSGTGKTTLLKQLIPILIEKNIRPGLIKHTHHDMDIDKPGKDSYELRRAGSVQTIVASEKRWALVTETPEKSPLSLTYLLSQMDPKLIDIVLIEGFKHEPVEKILLHREELHISENRLLIDDYVIAVASDIALNIPLPILSINDPQTIADFILEWLKDKSSSEKMT